MPLNPSPQRQSIVTFPTPNVNDILFFESVDAERVSTDIPAYGTKHPDYKKWPNHRLVHVESSDDQRQGRYYRYYYAADQLNQDEDNWSFSKADIGGTKFDAVTRDYVVRRSEFTPDTPAMGDAMDNVPAGKFSGTHVLAERKQVPLNDKILNGLYVVEQRVYVKKVPLTRLDFDDYFQTTNKTEQTLYYRTESPTGGGSAKIEALATEPDSPYWGMHSGTVRTVQQLTANWYAVTEREVVKCSTPRSNLQTITGSSTSDSSLAEATEGKNTTNLNLFSTYAGITAPATLPALIRNTDCWAHGFKGVTGFVAWSSKAGQENWQGGALVTPRHVLVAKHAPYLDGRIHTEDPPVTFEAGEDIYFCAKHNNVVHKRKVISTLVHSTYDYAICLLDSDLPHSIEVVKVLPEEAYKYFQTDRFTNESWSATGASEEVLVMTTDKDENAHIRKIQSLEFGDLNGNPDTVSREFTLGPTSAYAAAWGPNVIGGDSGSVATLVIGGECVLIGLITGIKNSTTVIGDFLGSPKNFREINALITATDVDYQTATSLAAGQENFYVTGYQLQAFDLSPDHKSHRGAAYQETECARLRYETVRNYEFPPILQGIAFDTWHMRSGGERTYPRVLYKKGAFRGPCRATVDISWSDKQPAGVVVDEKPAPEPFTLQTPLFTLSIPPTLHEAFNFAIGVGTEDETWEQTNGNFPMAATNITEWKSHLVSSEVKPFRGGWVMETITIYPPV